MLIVKKIMQNWTFFYQFGLLGKLNVDAPNMKHREDQSKNLEQNELSWPQLKFAL